MNKVELRLELEKLTAEFLASNKKIKILASSKIAIKKPARANNPKSRVETKGSIIFVSSSQHIGRVGTFSSSKSIT